MRKVQIKQLIEGRTDKDGLTETGVSTKHNIEEVLEVMSVAVMEKQA